MEGIRYLPDFVTLTLPQNRARVPTMRAPIQFYPLGIFLEVCAPMGIFPLLSIKVEIVQPSGQLVFLILLRGRRGLMMFVICGAFDHLIQPLNDQSPFLDTRPVVVQNCPGGQDREGLLMGYSCKLQELPRQLPLLESRLTTYQTVNLVDDQTRELTLSSRRSLLISGPL